MKAWYDANYASNTGEVYVIYAERRDVAKKILSEEEGVSFIEVRPLRVAVLDGDEGSVHDLLWLRAGFGLPCGSCGGAVRSPDEAVDAEGRAYHAECRPDLIRKEVLARGA